MSEHGAAPGGPPTGRAPWVVLVHEALRQPGTQRPVRVTAPLDDLGLSTATVPPGAPVEADLRIEAMTDGRITATGTVTAPWSGECRRCLEPVEGDVVATVQEVFERAPADGAETYRLDGDHLDLEPMVRDTVLLSLPLAPLCREGCAGPAPDVHPVGDAAGEQPPDPRWAALRDVRFD